MKKEFNDTNLIYQRNELLWGNKFQKVLWNKHVIIFGLGGVGGHATEALIRSGIGSVSIVDHDTISLSNVNRQLLATLDNINKPKTEVMQEKILQINPGIKISKHKMYYDSSKNDVIFNGNVDFVVDAIDSVHSKIDLIQYCLDNDIKFISSMGTGNRLDPTQLYITDISETRGNSCPLTRKMRNYLKKSNITEGITVLTSKEPSLKPDYTLFTDSENPELRPPGSNALVPPAAGIIIASYVINNFLKEHLNKEKGR